MGVRLDRMQQGLFQVLQSELPDATVQWSYFQPSFEQLKSNLVNLQLLNPPVMVYQDRVRGTTYFPPALITLQIQVVQEGKNYYAEINDFIYAYEAQVGDTVDNIRDGLVIVLNANENDPFTAAPTVNAGEFTITPTNITSIYQAAISDNVIQVSLDLSTQAMSVANGTRQAVIQIQTFSKNPSVKNGAVSIMDSIQDITLKRSLVDILWNTYGVRIINFGVPSDLSAIAGASWESRVNADLTINLDSVVIETTDIVESVNFTLTTIAPGQLTSWENQFSIN